MKKFDYYVVDRPDWKLLENFLKDLGNKGWELISQDKSVLVFKREIPINYEYCESFDFQGMISQGWEPILGCTADHFIHTSKISHPKYLFRKEV